MVKSASFLFHIHSTMRSEGTREEKARHETLLREFRLQKSFFVIIVKFSKLLEVDYFLRLNMQMSFVISKITTQKSAWDAVITFLFYFLQAHVASVEKKFNNENFLQA